MRSSQIFIQNIDLSIAKQKFSEIYIENNIFCYKKNIETQNIEPYLCLQNLHDIFDKKIFKQEIQKIEFNSLDLLLYCKNDTENIYILKQFKNNPSIRKKREQIINKTVPLVKNQISTYFKSLREILVENNMVTHKHKNPNEYKKTDKIKIVFSFKNKSTIDIIIKNKTFIIVSKKNVFDLENKDIKLIESIFLETMEYSFNSDFVFGISRNVDLEKISFSIKGDLYLNAKFSFTFLHRAVQYKIIKKSNYDYNLLKEIISELFDFLLTNLKNEAKK